MKADDVIDLSHSPVPSRGENVIDLSNGDVESPHIFNGTSRSSFSDRDIRAQQDDAFELSRAIDLSRQQKEKDEIAARKMEAERRAQTEREEKISMERKRTVLGVEPDESEEDTITFMFKLPDGTRRPRRFRNVDKFEVTFSSSLFRRNERVRHRLTFPFLPGRPDLSQSVSAESYILFGYCPVRNGTSYEELYRHDATTEDHQAKRRVGSNVGVESDALS